MANLRSYDYPGVGDWARENVYYTQAIRVDKTILCSGQGGWKPDQTDINPETMVEPDLMDEIDQAFSNCDHNLRNAGGKGWSQVYRITTYSTDIPAQHERIVANLRKWMPNHRAIWTELGISHLGLPTMHIEIDVEAYDPEGAAQAEKK